MRLRASKIRKTAPWLARLAVFALLFQISAVDHQWNPESATIEGEVGTANHTMHCHGAVSGCANGGSDVPSALHVPTVLPSETLPLLLASVEDLMAPAGAIIDVEKQPPRAQYL